MAAKPESALQAKIQKFIRSKGGWSVKYHGGPHSIAGTPDLLICYRGLFIAIEVKLPGKEYRNPTVLQQEKIKQINAAGGISLVMVSVEQLEQLFDIIDRNYDKIKVDTFNRKCYNLITKILKKENEK